MDEMEKGRVKRQTVLQGRGEMLAPNREAPGGKLDG